MTDFAEAEWQAIETHLQNTPNYGMPERRDGSVVIASWNIRKFGQFEENGVTKKSPGAFRMIERFCSECDLVAIQETQRNTESLYELRDRLNAAGGSYQILISDVTGEAPGRKGMAERMAWLYNTQRVKRGDLVSDLTFDRSAVVENINVALKKSIAAEMEAQDDAGLLEKLKAWFDGQVRIAGSKLTSFVQFIRSPHIAEFIIEGVGKPYEFYCINAHLVSGKRKREREQEFFALLEWLLFDSERTVVKDGKTYLLLADLNLDFKSNLDKRREGIETYITNLNRERDLKAKVNFPFLDGGYFTNARRDETFDHIAWISNDKRLPRGRHNDLAGTLGPDQYDYGMFDFTQLFFDAGPGKAADGSIDYDRFSHDFSDHMPIWIRLPIPDPGQSLFNVDGD
jgi:endonuclease/exonuclease/phosphatase family metal-dependent hydrolase